MANLPALFNSQFFRMVDGVLVPAASCQLWTRPAGDPVGEQESYTTQAGDVPNANPIILDSEGRCSLWLDGDLEYLLDLRDPVDEGGGVIKQWDDVTGAAATTGVVTSVNGETGEVVLTPELIDYEASTAPSWFTGANLQDALDQILVRLDAPPADSVPIEDAGDYFDADNVEDALQALAESSLLPDRTDNEGKVLALDDALDLEWIDLLSGTLGNAAEVSIGGLHIKWGTTSSVSTDSATNVSFSTPFPTACFGVLLNPTADNGVQNPGANYSYGASLKTTTGFKINNDSAASAFFWLAIGN